MESRDNLQVVLMAIPYPSVHFLSPLQCPPPYGEKGTGGLGRKIEVGGSVRLTEILKTWKCKNQK